MENFIHVYTAALRGLPESVRNDQVLVEAHLSPLLLCGGLLQLVHSQDAIKASGVGFELSLRDLLDLKLSGIGNNPGPHPVADSALIAAQRASRQLLVTVMAGYLFGSHGGIMALAIWYLP